MISFYNDPNASSTDASAPVQPQQTGLNRLRRSPMGKGISAGLGQFGNTMGGGGVRQQMPPQGPPPMGQMRQPMQGPPPSMGTDQLAPQSLPPAPTPQQAGYVDQAGAAGPLGPTTPPQPGMLDKFRKSPGGRGLAAGLSQFGQSMGGTGYKGPQFY